MNTPRVSTLALCVGAALLAASCGGDAESDADDRPVSTSEDSTTTAPPTTVAARATTAPATSTTVPATTAPATPTIASTTTAASTTTTIPVTTTIATTTTAPAPATTTTMAPAVVEYCASAGPLPDGAVLDYSLTLDIMDDGTANDLIEAYDVAGWSRLRLTTGESVVSEIINPAIDGRYRPLGIATVFPGDSAELFVVIGEGSAAAEIGVFGIDSADCLFSYTFTGTSDDFTLLIRPESPFRSGAACFDGGIGIYSAEQQGDGTWAASGAAYEIATPWTVQYMGGSDDYSEGLDESDLTTFEFNCFGLSL